MKLNTIKITWIFLLMLIFAGACLSEGNETVILETETFVQTSLPVETVTLVSPSFIPSITHTQTPLPTLSEDEKLTLSKRLLTTNADCKLPCWWGFTPGETKWEDARRFLETLAILFHPIEREDDILIEVKFPVSEEFNPSAAEFPGPGILYNDYYIKDGIIEAIEVDVGLAHTYDLPILLEEYGQPDEVYIDTHPESVQGDLPFGIFVYYKHHGIFSYYEVQGSELGDEIQGCFVNESVVFMVLWPPDKEWSIIEVSKRVDFHFAAYGYTYLLEEVTDMDEESFYQKYKGTTEPICITVPREPFYYRNE